MSCNTLCPCISSVWEQYCKIFHNFHFDHVIWYHNAFCIIFVWKMSLWICCDIIRLIWTAANIKFNVFCLKSNKTCFSNLCWPYFYSLSPVYTMQVLHPSLHSSFLNSSFLIVYTIQETWFKKLERTWME